MTLGFMVLAFAMLIMAFLLEGGVLTGLLGVSPAMIVFGGVIGATGVTIPLANYKNAGKVLAIALGNKKYDNITIINQFKEYATIARKDGLLALESVATSDDVDEFIKLGLTMVVDGTDHELVKDILLTKVEQMSKRHKANLATYESAGGYAPTMGIIGTVMGLVSVLKNLSDSSTLGPHIASAFLATLYGISSANLIFLPIASKCKAIDALEVNQKLMIIEALASLSSGESPTVIVQKLKVFLNAAELDSFENQGGKKDKGVEE